jgi:hypothetical protein
VRTAGSGAARRTSQLQTTKTSRASDKTRKILNCIAPVVIPIVILAVIIFMD